MKKTLLAVIFVIILLGIWQNVPAPNVAAQAPVTDTGSTQSISPRNLLYPVLEGSDQISQMLWTGEHILEIDEDETLPAGIESLDLPDAESFQNMAFQSYRDYTWEIYQAFGVDHQNPPVMRLTYDVVFDGEPDYNRGCTRITFMSERDGDLEIYSMDSSGWYIQRLTWDAGDDYSPVWSYDDANIAFVSERDGNPEIYIMAPDGSNLHRISYDPATDFSPTFSPDGSQIAWLRVLDSQNGLVVVANADGTNPHSVGSPLRFVYDLTWSRDGTRFTFDYDGDWNGWNELGMMNSDGNNLRSLWNPGAEKDAWAGSWSVTNANIFFSNITYIQYQGQYYIYRVDTYRYKVDMGGPDQIFTDRYDFYPSACPSDISIPQSSVVPLPFYSRAGGFLVGWQAFDPGPAFFYIVHIQSRAGISGDWTDWTASLDEIGAKIFTASSGQTIYFRSQAEDNAENWEPWPPGDGDTSTHIFTWLLHGTVTDLRGQPLPGVPIDVSPAPWNVLNSNHSGAYTAFLQTSGLHTLSSQLPGYSTFPASSLDMMRDEQLNTYLPPETDWMINGGFESQPDPFAGWGFSAPPITPTLDGGHSGAYSARLGMPCDPPCFDDEQVLTAIENNESEASIATDPFGNVHILFEYRKYMRQDAQGNWTGPEYIGNLQDPGNLSMRTALAIDAQGGVHAIVDGAGVGIEYYYKPVGGIWEQQHDLGSGTGITNPVIAVNDQGTVLILYCDTWTTYYLVRQSSGDWGTPQELSHYAANDMALVTDPAGNFHVVYAAVAGPAIYLQFDLYGTPVSGNWAHENECSDIRLAIGPDGTLHLLFEEFDYMTPWYYQTLRPGGGWSLPVIVDDVLMDASIGVDSSGVAHVLGIDQCDGFDCPVYYYRKTAEENYLSWVYAFPGSYFADISLAIDSDGGMHAVWGDWFELKYRETMLWSAASPAWLATNLSVPAEMHQPTLSFMYRMDSNLDLAADFDVYLTENLTSPVTSTIFSTSQPGGWDLGWVDLQPWSGQTITLTFSLREPVGALPAFVWIDSISSGEWWTPVITDVTPGHLGAGDGGWITISGSNFAPTPSVRLGEISLSEVVFIDEHTLQANIPPDTPMGIYDVYVLTPAGQIGLSPRAVEIGFHLFLPLVRR